MFLASTMMYCNEDWHGELGHMRDVGYVKNEVEYAVIQVSEEWWTEIECNIVTNMRLIQQSSLLIDKLPVYQHRGSAQNIVGNEKSGATRIRLILEWNS